MRTVEFKAASVTGFVSILCLLALLAGTESVVLFLVLSILASKVYADSTRWFEGHEGQTH